MTMANLNPNGISGPAQPPAPQPGMGIMAMMSAAVPPPVGGILPAATTTSATSSTSNSEVQQPQMTSNLVLAYNNIRRKSSSPNVALINVTNPGSHIIEFFFVMNNTLQAGLLIDSKNTSTYIERVYMVKYVPHYFLS